MFGERCYSAPLVLRLEAESVFFRFTAGNGRAEHGDRSLRFYGNGHANNFEIFFRRFVLLKQGFYGFSAVPHRGGRSVCRKKEQAFLDVFAKNRKDRSRRIQAQKVACRTPFLSCSYTRGCCTRLKRKQSRMCRTFFPLLPQGQKNHCKEYASDRSEMRRPGGRLADEFHP